MDLTVLFNSPFRTGFPCALLVLFLACCQLNGQVQKRHANHWYFGEQAGIHFTNGDPVALTDGQMTQNEGSGTISDADGNLLFYTNGVEVWDANHNLMPNGTGLIGNESSAQVLIAPWPGNSERYCIFHTDYYLGLAGVYYSVVDMTLNNGLGDVIPNQKNRLLHANSEEKMAVTHHFNGRDLWVLVMDHTTDEFVVFPFTKNGFGPPVNSPAGVLTNFALSNLKVSPNGHWAAYTNSIDAQQFGADTKLFTFNNFTGKLQLHSSIPVGTPSFAYGLAFSPDNSKLYLSYAAWDSPTDYSVLSQYSLLASDVAASKIDVSIHPGKHNYYSLQLGPNGKIYAAIDQQPFLAEIEQPNLAGIECLFQRKAVPLQERLSLRGLPYFINSTLFPATLNAGMNIEGQCINQPVSFDVATYAEHADSSRFTWDFGDGSSAATQTNPTQHTYSSVGIYNITLLRWYYFGDSAYHDTLFQPIKIIAADTFSLSDTLVCPGTLVEYEIDGISSYISWSTGVIGPSIELSNPGAYWAESNNGCRYREHFLLQNSPDLTPDLGLDQVKCPDEHIVLDASHQDATSYQWHNQSSDAVYEAERPGTYWVEVSDADCAFRDSITIEDETPLPPELGPDTSICIDENLVLDISNPRYTSYLWSDYSTTSQQTVQDSGLIWVETTDRCFVTSDSMHVAIHECPCKLYIPSAFTPNDNFRNDEFMPKGVCRYETYQFRIFDRWGKVLFHTSNPAVGWNGRVNGQLVRPGVYVYRLDYSGSDNGAPVKQQEVGKVVLLR